MAESQRHAVGASAPARTAETTPQAELGSRAHVGQTLERVRAALAGARPGPLRRGPDVTFAIALAERAASGRLVPQPLRAQLLESVAAYARELRAEGVPSQRMLVLVKSAIREAMPQQLRADEARALTDDLVRESITAFYGGAAQG